MFNATNSNAIISKSKIICSMSFSISWIYIKFWTLWKERATQVNCFWNYRMEKAGLLKCLKSRVSEHWWTVNRLKGPKHWLSLQNNIFVIFLNIITENQFKKGCFSSIWNVKAVNILTPHEKYSLSLKASI